MAGRTELLMVSNKVIDVNEMVWRKWQMAWGSGLSTDGQVDSRLQGWRLR